MVPWYKPFCTPVKSLSFRIARCQTAPHYRLFFASKLSTILSTGGIMPSSMSPAQEPQLLRRGFSRRSFGRIATVLGAGAALPFYNEHALAQLSKLHNLPPDAVKINANENPLGPCPEAADAI